ncbi:hypothetical protein [Cribrihabitans neustonicus]|uniref:hypothetical protein n=1 Tax=Cribrihabitans neustonicus TaxID=1429085 RepID=UPI003B596DBA
MCWARATTLAAAKQAARDLGRTLVRLLKWRGAGAARRSGETPKPRAEAVPEDGLETGDKEAGGKLHQEGAARQQQRVPPDCEGGEAGNGDVPGRYGGGRYRG